MHHFFLNTIDGILEVMAKVLNYDADTKRVYKQELEKAVKEAINPNDQPAIAK